MGDEQSIEEPVEQRETLYSLPDQDIWSACKAGEFEVRQAGYRQARQKGPSDEALYECINLRWVRGAGGRITHEDIFAQVEQEGWLAATAESTDEFQDCDGEGGDETWQKEVLPEYFVVNAQLPWEAPSVLGSLTGKSKHEDSGSSLISYFRVQPEVVQRSPKSVALFKRLLSQGESLRNSTSSPSFKVIGITDNFHQLGLPESCRGYNGKPVLITTSSVWRRRGTVLVCDYDVRSWGHLTKLSLHQALSNKGSEACAGRVAYFCEGKDDSELPEQILGCFYMRNISREGIPVVNAGSFSRSGSRHHSRADDDDTVSTASTVKSRSIFNRLGLK